MIKQTPAPIKDFNTQKVLFEDTILIYDWLQSQISLSITFVLCLVQRSVGPDQNPLKLPHNPELDQLLKEGCTFIVLDQPVSLDRLQLKNIDQLNASSTDNTPAVSRTRTYDKLPCDNRSWL